MAVDVADDTVLAELLQPHRNASKLWAVTWPKLVAIALFLGVWQIVVWSGWKPEYILPSPFTVLNELVHHLGDWSSAAWVTLRRAVIGFAIAILVGAVIGIAVARSRIL